MKYIKSIKIATLLLTGLIANANAVVNYAGNSVYTSYGSEDIITKFDVNAITNASIWDNMGGQIFDTFKSKVKGISLDKNGTGFVVTDNGNLDFYQNGKFVTTSRTFSGDLTGVSYTGNAVYMTDNLEGDEFYYPKLFRCSALGTYCQSIDEFKHGTTGVSFDANANGYVITNEGNLDKYVNNNFIGSVSYRFDGTPTGVSYTGNAVYVVTTSPNQLYKCSVDNKAECTPIHDFTKDFPKEQFNKNTPVGVSFDANGNGYVDSSLTAAKGTYKALSVFSKDNLVEIRHENNGGAASEAIAGTARFPWAQK